MPRRGLLAALFAAFACFYGLTGVGYVCSPDGAVMLQVTGSIVERGRTDIRELERWPGFGGRSAEDSSGRRVFHAKYGLALPLAAIPGYLAGKALLPLASAGDRDLFETGYERDRRRDRNPDDARFTLADPSRFRVVWYRTGRENFAEVLPAFFASLTNAFVGAAIVCAVFLCALELGSAPVAALMLATVTGLATPLWHYSRTFFAEPLASLGILLFLLGAIRGRRSAGARAWLLSGAGLGLSVLAKPVHAVLFLPALVLLEPWSREWRRPARHRAAAAWLAGVAGPVGMALAYNALRFGSAWETGYGAEASRWTTPFLEGLGGLLVSPGRGFLFYHPLWVLGAAGFAPFARRAPREARFVALSFATLVLTYATWHQWEGGWCWGPRFLSVAVPLVMLPAAPLFDAALRSRRARLAVGAAAGAGLVVAFSGVMVHYVDYLNWLKSAFAVQPLSFGGARDYYELMCWSRDYSPLVHYWGFEPKQGFFVARAVAVPGVVAATYAILAAGCVTATWRTVRLVRAPAAPIPPPDAPRAASPRRAARRGSAPRR